MLLVVCEVKYSNLFLNSSRKMVVVVKFVEINNFETTTSVHVTIKKACTSTTATVNAAHTSVSIDPMSSFTLVIFEDSVLNIRGLVDYSIDVSMDSKSVEFVNINMPSHSDSSECRAVCATNPTDPLQQHVWQTLSDMQYIDPDVVNLCMGPVPTSCASSTPQRRTVADI